MRLLTEITIFIGFLHITEFIFIAKTYIRIGPAGYKTQYILETLNFYSCNYLNNGTYIIGALG